MALKNRIDAAAAERGLVAWLSGRMPEAGDVRVSDVSVPAAGGVSAESVRFTAAWRDAGGEHREAFVARVVPADESGYLYMTYDLEAEARALRAFAAHTSVPVPDVVHVESDPSVLGGPFMTTRAIAGRIPADDPPFTQEGWVLELPPKAQGRLHDNGLKVLAELHAADYRDLGLADLLPAGGEADVLQQQLDAWRRAYEWAGDGRPNRVLDAAWEWIDEHRPREPEPVVVSWGDARIGNMIFAEDLSVAAVLDWEQMCLASRELDLSWWLVTLRHHCAGLGHPLPPGFPTFEAIVGRYEELTGHEVRHLHFYEVFSAVRLAVLAVRAATLLIDAEILPTDTVMPRNNPPISVLSELLGLPAATEAGDYWVGKR